MSKIQTFFFLIFAAASLFLFTNIHAEVVIEPYGAAISLGEDDENAELVFNILNTGNQDINYQIGIDIRDIGEDEFGLIGQNVPRIEDRHCRTNVGPVAQRFIERIPRHDSTLEPYSVERDDDDQEFRNHRLNNRGENPSRDEPNEIRILLIKSSADRGYGWGDSDAWLEVFQNQDEEIDRADIENIGDIDLDNYDMICTGEDQSAQFFNSFMNNREIFEEFVDGGGLFSFFAGGNTIVEFDLFTNEGDIHVSGIGNQWQVQVNDIFVNDDGDGLIEGIEEDFTFLTPFEFYRDDQNHENRRRVTMINTGGSLTRVAVPQDDMPEDGTWYYRPIDQQPNMSTHADWPFGRGWVLFTGTTGTFIYERYQWASMMECTNLLLWAEGRRTPKWISIEEDEGIIQPDEDVDVIVALNTLDLEPATYYAVLEIEHDSPGQSMLEIPVLMSFGVPVFNIEGEITNAGNEQPIENAMLNTDPFGFKRNSDGEGMWSINNLPLGEYQFTFAATDFLPTSRELAVDEPDDVQLDVALLHSQCNPDQEEISAELDPDQSIETGLTISNDGNGPLTYTTDRRLLGDANAEPWELRVDYPAGVIAEDSRIQGAVYIDDLFYVSGANNREPLIYVLNRDQEVVNQYAQLGEGRYGYKDLAWDGELIWGSGERVIYGFTLDGEQVTTFDSGISPCNNLAWDADREILWGSGTTTDIIGYDRDGNVVGEVARGEYRVYGLAYWPDDPDGYQLYVFHKINEVGDLMIAKLNIDNGDAMDVVSLEHEAGGVAQGCFITNQYDIYSWVFMGVANSGAEDRIDIWQIDARKDWMAIDPTEGVIEGGEEQEFIVTLDATGLPEAPFEGEIVFIHDGVGGETHIPITLQVGDGQGGGPEEMVLELANGWNMVSAYVQPDPDDIIEIMVDLVEAGTLIMVKNGTGQFYNPQFNFNNIPGWRVNEGYMMKMDGADELILAGEAVPWNEPIALDGGWQMISYYPRQGVDAVLALSGIVDVLIMAKDGQGRFYNPQFNFSNMGDMIPGQGYLLKMDEAAELVYTVEEELVNRTLPYLQADILPIHNNTGENMSLLLYSDISEGEVGVYANGVLVGSGVIQDGICGIAVWGDDPTTPEVDGAIVGDVLKISIHDGIELQTAKLENIQGENKYLTNGFYVGNVLNNSTLPLEFGIVDAYPNPFNSSTNITYNLPNAADVEIALYDLAGRQIVQLLLNNKHTGQHTITIDGSSLSSGVYLMQLQANGEASKRKLTLIK